MRTKQIIILILIYSSSTLFFSCKKYEEGSIISLRTVNSRLIGKWKLKYFNIEEYYPESNTSLKCNFDGDSVDENINEVFKTYPLQLELKFTENTVIISKLNDESYKCDWKWYNGSSKKEIISMGKIFGERYNVLYYKIIKLTNKELVLECNNEYWVQKINSTYKFEKIE